VTDPRRRIPGVDVLLGDPSFRPVLEGSPRGRVVSILRDVLAAVRERLAEASPGAAGVPSDPADAAWYADEVSRRLHHADRPSLRRLVNATGVVLHTNLGRAPLADAARVAMAEAAGYVGLEIDLQAGGRGGRHDHCAGVLRELTRADAALVVNNNAAAVVLALNTLAAGRDAVVSRGELVEIGGSFRVPEIMARSGARMREVGSTNRTHPADYEEALAARPGIVLKVHRSNFRVEGFTAEVSTAELASLASAAGVPLLDDLGSGALLDMTTLGLPPEPTAGDAVAAGADVVTLSGDKLLGGPQAGIILGRRDLVARMRANPLYRALRPDKITLAGLAATLALYRDPETVVRRIPTLRMLATPVAELEARAEALAARLRDRGVATAVEDGVSAVGGGAYPGVELPTRVIVVDPGEADVDAVAARLRTGEPGVVARVRNGRLRLDPRTVDPAEEADLVRAVARATGGHG
jgi:L-seryl-tRNA(Ser) seleniumtransferase